MDLALRALLQRQHRDGLWRDFRTLAGEGAEWPTGYVASCLAPIEGTAEALRRARAKLVDGQLQDGGWSYNESVPADVDSTAFVLLGLGDRPEYGATRRRGAMYLSLIHI